MADDEQRETASEAQKAEAHRERADRDSRAEGDAVQQHEWEQSQHRCDADGGDDAEHPEVGLLVLDAFPLDSGRPPQKPRRRQPDDQCGTACQQYLDAERAREDGQCETTGEHTCTDSDACGRYHSTQFSSSCIIPVGSARNRHEQ